MKNLQDHPTARDVENGDALNAALDQLSDPTDFQLFTENRHGPDSMRRSSRTFRFVMRPKRSPSSCPR